MARITDVEVYFQGTCFPQKFVGVQIGFGARATLDPGDRAADVEAQLHARVRRRVESTITDIMSGTASDTQPEDTAAPRQVRTTR